MIQDFQKPFAAPPTIFSVSLIVGLLVGFLLPWSVLPWVVQLVLGPLVILAGVLTVHSSIREIEAANTTYDPYDVSTELVTSGIYQYSRNPGYLGLAVIQCGIAVLLDNVWIVIAGLIAATVTTVFVIRLEERKLTDAFGESYTDYQKHVRRWV
ncbi:methyltransferase family protein [Ruegeria arenilitoris]|uniref:methyltransferase family protein n=1 Tax=Ruegeria arenilitoris TaxID=1173585 RepID=UPI0014805F6F|nr:isoprenylcysteine carboxylmethyltransferase family protein [Ruegeria arenilitoris]